jgi:hypothetical protein
MQKISAYLYPNRTEIIADLSDFSTEFKSMYNRNIKIYNGIDNTIEFDFKNADQKRLDLNQFSIMELHVMDVSGQALDNSPYRITPTSLKGIGKVTIPELDLTELDKQCMKYSVTAIKDGNDIMMYTNTYFGAVGTIELIGDAVPTYRDPIIYDTFYSEIDHLGIPVHHSSSIPVKFYEAEKTQSVSLEIKVMGFVGSIWIDATSDDTISVESYRKAGKPFGSWTRSATDGLYTGIIPFGNNLTIDSYSHIRVSYQTTTGNGIGATFDVQCLDGEYMVTLHTGGTAYNVGSLIKVPGSQLGGIDGENDLFITVQSLMNAGTSLSSYIQSSIASVTWTGTSVGTGQFRISGTNWSGFIDKITLL